MRPGERYEPSWHDHANCAGMDTNQFFPERGESTKEAKAVCAGCVVQAECLDYALEHNIKFGVWGGRSEAQRRQLRKARRESAA